MKRGHPKVAPLARIGLRSARYSAAGNCAGCGASAAAALAAASFSRSSRMSASRLPATSRSPFIMAPVPAGIRRPTMTFSLRPSSVSILPLTAATVSTRVVSWNDAAEMNDRVCDLHLLQHLADDHLDMLVVDRDALQPIDVLDLVDEIGGELLDALDRQNVVRRRVALDDGVALLDHVAVLQMDVLALGDQVLLRLFAFVGRLDHDASLVLVVASETDGARGFGDDRGLLRPARLEQLRHPRQTAGDVAGLGALGRDARDDVAGLHVRSRIDRDDGVDGELVARLAATRQFHDLVVLVLDHDRRMQIDPAAGAPVGHHALGDAGRFVERLRHRLALDQVLEGDRALDLGEDRPGIGIPLRDALAALDLVIVLDQQARAVLDAMHRALGPVGIEHGDDHIAGHGDRLPVGVLHHVLVLDLDRAVEVRLDDRLLRDLRRAADMERAHGELRARLADRLRGDDAHRLAHVDRGAAGEIAPVALGAHAPGGLTGEHGADAQFLHAGGLDGLDLRLFEQRAFLDDDLVRGRVAHVLGR